MPYSNILSRADATDLIPAEMASEIIKAVAASNPLLSLARRLPDMSRAQRDMPVMSALATAYFVTGDTGLKQTSEVNWTGVHVTAEEIACIVPIPEAVLDDSAYDIWGEVKPALVEAFGVAIAQAVLYGTKIVRCMVSGCSRNHASPCCHCSGSMPRMTGIIVQRSLG